MAMESSDTQDTGRYQRVGVFALVVVVALLVALVRSGLETPSGDGVPGPDDWAREQSQTRP